MDKLNDEQFEKKITEISNAIYFSKFIKQRTDKLRYELTISPDQVHLYQKLQQEIAKQIPNEHERPTITVNVLGNKRLNNPQKPDLGLLGGMGPLSDSNILKQMVDKANVNNGADNMFIKLYSAPPPRQVEKKTSYGHWFSHLKYYFLGLKNFGASGCQKYAMLSNTAHSNFSKFKRFLKQPSEAIHLVNEISAEICQDHPNKVLILGTSMAAQTQLYSKSLKAQSSSAIPVMPQTNVQSQLQNHIDQVKSGTDDEQSRQEFLDLIFDQIKQTAQSGGNRDPTHVILGCTEIPYFLDKKLENGKTYKDALLDKMQQDPFLKDRRIKLVDSEKKMLEILDKNLTTTQVANPNKTSDFRSFISLPKSMNPFKKTVDNPSSNINQENVDTNQTQNTPNKRH
jgi:aspartate/glutamate racemase